MAFLLTTQLATLKPRISAFNTLHHHSHYLPHTTPPIPHTTPPIPHTTPPITSLTSPLPSPPSHHSFPLSHHLPITRKPLTVDPAAPDHRLGHREAIGPPPSPPPTSLPSRKPLTVDPAAPDHRLGHTEAIGPPRSMCPATSGSAIPGQRGERGEVPSGTRRGALHRRTCWTRGY